MRLKKIENAIQVQVWVWVQTQNKSNMANSTGKLQAPDNENTLKWQANDTQGSATHSGLLSKKTH